MSGINIGHLYKKRTVRKMDGSIYHMVDEANGGVIIQGGRVVNQEAVDELARKELDRKTAAVAFTQEVAAPSQVIEERTAAPTKVEKLEKEMESLKGDIASILKLLQSKQ